MDLVQQREERRLTLRVNEDGVKEWKLLKEDEMTPKELEKAAGYSSGYVEPEHDN